MISDDRMLDGGIQMVCVEVVRNGICQSSWIIEIVVEMLEAVVSLREYLYPVTFRVISREKSGRVVLLVTLGLSWVMRPVKD